MGDNIVHRDAQELGLMLIKHVQGFVIKGKLATANRGCIFRVKDQHYWLALELVQGYGLPVRGQ